MATAPKTRPTPDHWPFVSLWSKTNTLKSIVTILRVTVMVTSVSDPYSDSVTKMKIWPTAPVRPKRRMSSRTEGCDAMKARDDDSSFEWAPVAAETGRRKEGRSEYGVTRAAKVKRVAKRFMKNIICGPSRVYVEKTWSCVALVTPSRRRLTARSTSPSRLLDSGPPPPLLPTLTGLNAMKA